ncbi:hypothetical protein SAY86_009584 [Trapa natans]|uniref:DUF7812 domain-containing protein n=1 Tax=Trapa natans TaxID=22666 RepID=A0AAN7QPW0_TRANT|nr:hypothetical protein SAY86_009584 [Trapa natans]
MSTALSLLLNPILLSAPQLFQAHVILLVSEAINTGMAWENMGVHIREVDYYLVAFEKSLYMYKRHISSYWDNKPMDHRDASLYSCSRDRSIPSFRSCIMEKTGQKLDFLDAKVQSLWDQHMQQNKTPESKSGLLSASITYIKENADFLEETHADEIISVLVSLTLRSFNDAPSDSIICLKPGGNPKIIYILSSILRLMARSLSSIMWCLNHSGSTGRLNRLKNSSPCRVYELLLHAMCCFQQFDVHLPVQTSFCKMLKAHPVSRHEQSNWMLMHFYDLLSLSFASGFDFLVKSCLSVMIQLLNLFVFEEGSIAALKSFFSPEDQSSAFGQYPRDEEAAEQGSSEKRKKSSQIASTFLKIHRQCPRIQGELGDHVEPFSLDNAREETCSGEVFFNCLMEGSREDFSDLVDFVELKENKDYSLWLKNRQKYHKWRLEKTAVLRWKRKKMMPRWKRE